MNPFGAICTAPPLSIRLFTLTDRDDNNNHDIYNDEKDSSIKTNIVARRGRLLSRR